MSSAVQSHAVLPAGGLLTNAQLPSWYAVYTRARHEKKVCVGLAAAGITAFLPLVTQIHRWSDRRQKVELPLFPGYSFVSILPTPESRVAVLKISGVVGFVGKQGEGTPVPEYEIDRVRTVVANNVNFSSHPFLKTGQRVRIRGGSLDGIEGILSDAKGNGLLIISIELIQRSIAVSIDGYDVEPA